LERPVKHDRVEEIDALRGIAAILVVFFHLTFKKSGQIAFFKLGVTGVDLFFIISGFVIYMSLTGIRNTREFVIHRVSRLYPTYWACVTLTFIFICVRSHFYKGANVPFISVGDYLADMTMFQYYFGIKDLDGPYWTMLVEMLFYFGIGMLFYFTLLKQSNLIGIILSIAAVILTNFFYCHPLSHEIISEVPLLTFLPLFIAGTTFYQLYYGSGKVLQHYLIALICLVCQILLFNYGGKSHFYLTQSEYGGMVLIYFLLFILFVHGKLKFIVNKVTLFLGKISYSLYLIHQFLAVNVIIPILTRMMHINYWVASFFIALPLILLVAFFINRYIEIPISRRMRQKLDTMAGNLQKSAAKGNSQTINNA
jgi:peptidoglycan/LPS O-acetylase OafA/YrhL